MERIHNFEKGLKRTKALLEKADIPKENKELIRRFVQYQAAQGIGKARLKVISPNGAKKQEALASFLR